MDDIIADELTILRFRRLLERHGLSGQIFALVWGRLEQKRLLNSRTIVDGTIIDGTIIDAPSTKNQAKARDPQMKHARRTRRKWRFRMKLHVGTDQTGLAHTPVTIHAGMADITQLPQLQHGTERELYEDQSYCIEMHGLASKECGLRYRVNRGPARGRRLNEQQRRLNRLRAAVGCGVSEHFRWSSSCGGTARFATQALAKNAAQLLTMFVLANWSGDGCCQ